MTPTPANDNTPRPACFDQLLLDYQPFIYKRCRNVPDVEEAAQAITLRALEKWHQYKPAQDGQPRNFATWLSFMCRDVLRERKPQAAPQHMPVATPPTQEAALDIKTAMSRLTKREARAVTLVATGYTKLETCKRMRLSLVGLDKMLRRARGKVANDNAPARKVA
jgi:DNA-directed RNA polymerase specialized sigma24 family protein